MSPKNVDISVKCNVLQCFQPILNRIAICLANQKRAGPRATGRPPTPAVGSLTRGSAVAYCTDAFFGARDGARIRSTAPSGSGAVCPSAIRSVLSPRILAKHVLEHILQASFGWTPRDGAHSRPCSWH